MSRKLILTAFVAIFGIFTVSTSSCMYLNGVDGNGDVQKENRDVSGFDAIRVGGAFEVILTQGNSESLVVEADANLMPLIRTEVRNHVLIIDTEKNIRNAEDLNLYITFKTLKNLRLSGAVEVKSENNIRTDALRIEGSGASEVTLDLITDELSCEFSGACEINLSGSAATCDINLTGASEVDAYDFEIGTLDIEISGAGDADVNVTGDLRARVSGAGTVRYKGNPRVDSYTSGAGSVKKR